MSDFLHIVDRFLIHFFMSAGFLMIAVYGFYWLTRIRWLPALHGWWAYIVPAMVSFILISFREVFDVANGQLVVKAVTDWASWILGMGVSIFGLFRMTPLLHRVRMEIRTGGK